MLPLPITAILMPARVTVNRHDHHGGPRSEYDRDEDDTFANALVPIRMGVGGLLRQEGRESSVLDKVVEIRKSEDLAVGTHE